MSRPERPEGRAPEEVWEEEEDEHHPTRRLSSWSPPAAAATGEDPEQLGAHEEAMPPIPTGMAAWSSSRTSRPPASSQPVSVPSSSSAQGRNPGASVIVDEPTLAPMTRASRMGLIVALVVSALMVIALTAFLLTRSPGANQPSGEGAPSSQPETPPAPGPGAMTVPASVSPTEAAAHAALWRLAEGVRGCASSVIGELPGTAPAIPPSFAQLKAGPYTSGPGDYRSPVYSCTSFRQSEPQAFQIQWQVFKGGTDGMAIAWLDGNGDGSPDRAIGLRVKLVKKGEITLGDQVEALEPLPPVAR